jgi:hypothetical protein
MNVRRSALILGFVAVLFSDCAAFAQDKPHNGFAMGLPAAAGVLLNVNDKIALWPELAGVAHLSSTNGPSSVDNNSFGAGIRALFYLSPVQAFRPYFVPQFDYTRTHNSSDTSLAAIAPAATTLSLYSTAVSFGAQYAMSARFGVFGEAGLEYSHGKGTGFIASTENEISNRRAVGVIVFF